MIYTMKTNVRILIIIIIVLVNICASYGQIKIQGFVLDENEQPISEVVIFCIEKGNNRVTQSILVDSIG